MRKALAVLTVSALVQIGTVAPASAAPTWEVTPIPSTSWDRSIYEIAPIGTNDAIAVGSVEESWWLTEWRALAWRFNGTRWVEQATPTDSGTLTSVAAASANDIWALSGSMYRPQEVTGAWAHRWNGTAWSTTTIPDHPSGGKVTARDIGVAGGTVWVVGSYEVTPADWPDSNPAPAILRWNGTGWSYVTVPVPSGEAYLQEVHVLSANNVWATGVERVTGGERPFVVRWDGTSWSRATTPSTLNRVRLTTGLVRANQEVWFGGATLESDNLSIDDTFAMRSTGGAYTVTPTPPSPQYRSYIATFGERGSELWAGGDAETPLLKWTGTVWQAGQGPAVGRLEPRFMVAAPGNTMWMTGRATQPAGGLSGPFIARLAG